MDFFAIAVATFVGIAVGSIFTYQWTMEKVEEWLAKHVELEHRR